MDYRNKYLIANGIPGKDIKRIVTVGTQDHEIVSSVAVDRPSHDDMN